MPPPLLTIGSPDLPHPSRSGSGASDDLTRSMGACLSVKKLEREMQPVRRAATGGGDLPPCRCEPPPDQAHRRHSGSLPTLVEHTSRMEKATSYIIDKDSQPTMFPTHQRSYQF